jgi:phage gpG-like protein
MSEVSIAVDTNAATIRLKSLAPNARRAVDEVVAADTAKLQDIVRGKLSGDVLNARSGKLIGSIEQDSSDGTGRVFSDLDYARVQEYGGRIDVPEIEPVNAKALAFEYEGKLVFAKHTQPHTVTIPERSFLRSSLAEFAPQFAADMDAAVAGALA